MPSMKTVKCAVCGKEYSITLKRYNAKINEHSEFYCSPECKSHKGSMLCTCANCGKEVWRQKSQIKKSKTGLVYCCVSCAVSNNNKLFKTGENHPTYNGASYRYFAFEKYPHKCVVCGYDEDERILEVHHIDEDRENNNIENLCILCPNCHKKITLHYYMLTKNFKLEPTLENEIKNVV